MIGLVIPGLAAFLSLAPLVSAQLHTEHKPSTSLDTIHALSREDARAPLGIAPTAAAGLQLTMREHLEAIHDIVAALGQQDFEQAAKVAREELGFLKHHQAMQRESGATFPPKYHELAMAHHQQAEDLAKVISSKDFRTILPQLERTIGACVSCHRAYKL
jgi:hypothetical protein